MEALLEFQTRIPDIKKILKRKRLLNILDQNLNYKNSITVLSAPAGYGKTALVANWIKNCSQKKAWFTVDENLNSSIYFIKALIKALKNNENSLFKNTELLLDSPLTLNPKTAAVTFIKDLQVINEEIILVIDNFDLVTNDLIFDFISFLLEYLPENLHLIVLSRKVQPNLVKKHRIKAEIIEISKEELSFNYLELTQLFKNIMDFKLSNNILQAIFTKTEGWPAALDFIAQKLAAGNIEDDKIFINNIIAENSYLIDYLLNETLSDLTAEEKEFLEQTVILKRFNPELADYLRGAADSSLLIKRLVDNNLFIESHNQGESWYRYHNLVSEILIDKLATAEKNKLYLKAASWYLENKYFKEAIFYVLKAEAYNLAVSYLEKSVPYYLKAGELKALIELLDLISDDYLKKSPLLLIIKAWFLFAASKKEDALYYINLINKKEDLSQENKGRLLTLTSLFSSYQDPEKHCREAAEALNLIAADDYIFRINALMSLGQIEASYSRHDDSIKTFKKAYYLAREKGQLFMEINSLMNLILKLAQAGRLEEALTLNLENIERLKKKDNQSEILIDLLDIPLGILYYYQADYKLAQNKIIRGIEAAEFLDLAHVVWMPKIYYALNSYQLGNKKLADQIIKETLSFTQKHNLKPNHLWAETINLSFELKNEKSNLNLFTAEKIKSYQTLIEQDTFAVLKTKVIFVMTRLFIREQKDREALAHLEKLNKLKIDYIDQITAQILKAVAFFNLNQKNESKKLLLAALLMIKKEKYFTAFIEDYDLLKESLAEFKDLKLALEEKIEFLSEKDSKKSQDHLIEPLTDREIEIIELLAEGYSNKKIAQKLFITEGTTKWHLSNIYSKLAVRNRTKAAAKARKLNII